MPKKTMVWRLEDSYGVGPYRSEHKSTSRALMGYCEAPVMYALSAHKSFNKRRFKKLCKKGWKFAWISEQLMFEHCNNNKEQLEELGFTITNLFVNHYRIFPDGQVMYKNRS